MDIPLVLRETKKGAAGGAGRLVYAIPLWFRALMAAITAILVGSLAVAGGPPGAVGWVVLAIAVLAALYEERWVLDAAAGTLTHRFGLLLLSRSVSLPFAEIERFRLGSFVRGSVPGGEEERKLGAAALATADPRGDAAVDAKSSRRRFKKTYVSLVCEAAAGDALVLNILPASRAQSLRETGRALAAFAGKPFKEGNGDQGA